MRRSTWLALASAMCVALPLSAQYPGGGFGGRGRGMGGGRRGGMMGARPAADIPTDPEVQGPPDLQLLALTADVDTIPLGAYRSSVASYRDSTRALRDSVWTALQTIEAGRDLGGDPTDRRAAFQVVQRLWPALKKRDEGFTRDVLKRQLPKKAFKAWDRAHKEEVDQARQAREAERGDGFGGGGRPPRD